MVGEEAQDHLVLHGCDPRPVSAEANPRLSVFHSFAFAWHQFGLKLRTFGIGHKQKPLPGTLSTAWGFLPQGCLFILTNARREFFLDSVVLLQ